MNLAPNNFQLIYSKDPTKSTVYFSNEIIISSQQLAQSLYEIVFRSRVVLSTHE
jgi:hypothetical protein